MKTKLAVILSMIAFLSACTSLDRLKRQDTSSVSPFNQELAEKYLLFAQSEEDQFDWFDSGYFARKGLKAARGEEVFPESIGQWDIPRSDVQNLQIMRERLLNVLTPSVKQELPINAANAQFLFDCWLEQLEENWQTDHITACHMEFLNELSRIENNLRKFEANNVEDLTEELEVEEKVEKLLDLEKKYVVYFGFDKVDISKDGTKVVNEISSMIKDMNSYKIKLGGHADLAGSDKYNMELSKRRNDSVLNVLVKNGAKDSMIEKVAYGEKMPVKATKDGVSEKLNRRVDVQISGTVIEDLSEIKEQN